ncbi:hypothetical protein HY605_02765 [Candidatus Peregrinibacteria bacterium]|nr:hypothetical protein [Candidatus Peregrinibacteria bacterium]
MAEENKENGQKYQTGKIPWFVTLLWVAFLLWAIWYTLSYFIPDIRSWLKF